MSKTLERIKEYIDYKGISIRAFEISCGFSNGSFASQLKNNKTIGVDKLENILNIYSEINANWILTGKGKMLNFELQNILQEPKLEYNFSENTNELIETQRQLLKMKDEKIAFLERELEKDKEGNANAS